MLGAKRSQDDLVLNFMPLARRIARRFHTPRYQDDLEQVAYLALVKAARRFDPSRGTAFSTYAIATITGEIKHYLRDHSWDLHVPRLLQQRALQAQYASDELAAELGRSATLDEVAARLELETEAVLEALEAAAARDTRSLDAPVEHATEIIPVARSAEDGRITRTLDRLSLRGALAVLPEDERRAIALRFFADMTQTEIAARMGISQMQVSRLLRRALKRLQTMSGGSLRRGGADPQIR